MKKILVNDVVLVTKGKGRGETGRVSRIDRKNGKAVVEGVNVVKRHQKPAGAFRAGGIIEKEMPVPLANLKFFHEDWNRPVKIGVRTLPDGTKVRFCKDSGEVIE